MGVPEIRRRAANARPLRPDGEYVLYWCTANRRTRSNFALERAVEHCVELGRPLVVLEALRCGYRHASDRIHRFVIEGMRDEVAALRAAGVTRHVYVEPISGAGKGLLDALAARACVVVADEAPVFFLPRMLEAAAARIDVRMEAVDSCGLLPLRAIPRAFPTAHGFRWHLQRELPQHLGNSPQPAPLDPLPRRPAVRIPREVLARWPAADLDALLAPGGLSDLPIDHGVDPVDEPGGSAAAARRLDRFVAQVLPRYAKDRDHPDADATSGLSAALHFGHLSAHEVFARIAQRERWTHTRLGRSRPSGKREGWWGMSSDAEAFLEQLVTWRELGYGFAFHRPDADRYESLPDWARATLEEHAKDRRNPVYSAQQLAASSTGDPVWNAAQTELRTTGRLNNYLRMVWGKLVLAWTRSPQDAFDLLFELNDRYALDGRDPNSASGIGWCFGRFDRAWGPERPVYGKVRYMTSASARRKLRMNAYLGRFGAAGETPRDG